MPCRCLDEVNTIYYQSWRQDEKYMFMKTKEDDIYDCFRQWQKTGEAKFSWTKINLHTEEVNFIQDKGTLLTVWKQVCDEILSS